jgi:Family of unknown function (DUF6352)
VAQDFWASSGFRLLDRRDGRLVPTAAWLARFLERDELLPPRDAGPREKAMHARLLSNPRAQVAPETLAAIEDPDARENWAELLRFRERVFAFPTLEACYLDLYRRDSVDLAPPFVDALAQAIVRGLLEGTEDPWLCRAGELLFRRQRVSTEGGQVLSADAATLEVFTDTGGFGTVGRLLKQQNTALPEVKMDVLNHENAQLYFLRDELHGFVLDLTPGREGAAALARVLERWVAHLAGVRVTIDPLDRIEDERWRWHVGLDVEASAILNALYKGEDVAAAQLERLVLLFRLEFQDPGDAVPEMAGKPVYLGLACKADRTLKVKPQNLVINLPLAASDEARRG